MTLAPGTNPIPIASPVQAAVVHHSGLILQKHGQVDIVIRVLAGRDVAVFDGLTPESKPVAAVSTARKDAERGTANLATRRHHTGSRQIREDGGDHRTGYANH